MSWEGFAQCHQLTWTQVAHLPGWSGETTVDAAELVLRDDSEHASTLTVFVPRGGLVNASAAVLPLCSATAIG